MTRIITIAQKKGGASKTTTSINLAGALIEEGYSVQVGDMNTEQRSSLKWANRGEEFQTIVIEISDKHTRKDVQDTINKNIDFLILDTPPELLTAALKAALLSDLVIIPCKPSPLDLEAAEETIELIEDANKPFVLLASDVDSRTSVGKQLPEALKRLGNTFETIIHHKVSIVEAAMAGQWVGSYAPNSESHKEYQALAYETVETLEKLK